MEGNEQKGSGEQKARKGWKECRLVCDGKDVAVVTRTKDGFNVRCSEGCMGCCPGAEGCC